MLGGEYLKGRGEGVVGLGLGLGGVSSEFMFNSPLFMFLGFYCYNSCRVEEEKNPL